MNRFKEFLAAYGLLSLFIVLNGIGLWLFWPQFQSYHTTPEVQLVIAGILCVFIFTLGLEVYWPTTANANDDNKGWISWSTWTAVLTFAIVQSILSPTPVFIMVSSIAVILWFLFTRLLHKQLYYNSKMIKRSFGSIVRELCMLSLILALNMAPALFMHLDQKARVVTIAANDEMDRSVEAAKLYTGASCDSEFITLVEPPKGSNRQAQLVVAGYPIPAYMARNLRIESGKNGNVVFVYDTGDPKDFHGPIGRKTIQKEDCFTHK